MDFTREPIIETVITPKEGFKLVVRSSKGVGQEEYFVDAVEVVTFGHSLFFRSLERPKSFLVPVNDYEILEVREARMILKNVGIDRSIKIGGGREGTFRREAPAEKQEAEQVAEEPVDTEGAAPAGDNRGDKKRDRRTRHRRRRGGRDEKEEGTAAKEETEVSAGSNLEAGHERIDLQEPGVHNRREPSEIAAGTTAILSALLPPPPTLISETIARYKENVLFKGAFYTKEEQAAKESGEPVAVQESTTSFSKEDEGYPSLDAIDEAIDRPTIPAQEPALEEAQSIEKDDLWDFTEDMKDKEED